MKKRDYPLFVVDTSRAHGRGKEMDYICCTDKECFFVASVEMMIDDEYKRLYDKTDYTSVWSDQHNGIRMYISIVSEPPLNVERTKSLLRRALKEMLLRRVPVKVDLSDVSDKAVENFAELLIQQTVQRIRTDGETKTDKAVMSILQKIKRDYGA